MRSRKGHAVLGAAIDLRWLDDLAAAAARAKPSGPGRIEAVTFIYLASDSLPSGDGSPARD
jgi:hypothetical protein